MKCALLKLEGGSQLVGVVEAGGDYLRFHTRTGMTAEAFCKLRDGQIEIDGEHERVSLESAQATRQGGYTIELTLRRIAPPV